MTCTEHVWILDGIGTGTGTDEVIWDWNYRCVKCGAAKSVESSDEKTS